MLRNDISPFTKLLIYIKFLSFILLCIRTCIFFKIYSFAFYISQITALGFIDMVNKELCDVFYFSLGHMICLSIYYIQNMLLSWTNLHSNPYCTSSQLHDVISLHRICFTTVNFVYFCQPPKIVIIKEGNIDRAPSMLSGTECSECALENVKSFQPLFLIEDIFLFCRKYIL